MFDLLSLTLDELWAINDYVRQTDKLGQEWDKDFSTRVMAGILEAQDSLKHEATVMMVEDELWQIHRQIPSALMTGTQPVGRNLLIKVMRLIVKLRGEGDDTDASEDTRQESGDGARTATESG